MQTVKTRPRFSYQLTEILLRITPDKSQLNSVERQVSAELKTLLNEWGGKLLPLDKISMATDYQLSLRLSQELLGGNMIKLSALSPELTNTIISHADSIKLGQEGNNLRLIFHSGKNARPQIVASLLYTGYIQKAENLYNLKTLISVSDISNLAKLNSSPLLPNTISQTSQQTNKVQELITDQLRQFKTIPNKLNESITSLSFNLNKLIESFSLVEVNLNSKNKYVLKELIAAGSSSPSKQVHNHLKTGNDNPLLSALRLLAENDTKGAAHALLGLRDLTQQLLNIVKPESRAQSLSIAHRLQTSGSQLENKLNNLTNHSEYRNLSKTNGLQVSDKSLADQDSLLKTDLKLVAKQLQDFAGFSNGRFDNSLSTTSNLFLALKPIFQHLIKNLDSNLLNQNLNSLSPNILNPNSLSANNISLRAQNLQQSSIQRSAASSLSVTQNIQALITPLISDFFSSQNISSDIATSSMLQSLSRAISDILSQFSTLNSGLKFALDPKVKEQLKIYQRPILEQIARHAESIVQRVEYNQLVSARSDFIGTPSFLVDLPIMHLGKLDSFELLFENNKKQKQQKSKVWKITVRFDLPPLGAMFARLTFKDNQLTTDIFAKEKETAELVNQHLDKLNESLFSAGVNVASISGQQGLVPESLEPQETDGINIRV